MLVIAVAIIIGITGFFSIKQLGNLLKDVTENKLIGVDALHDIDEAQTAIRSAERSLLIDDYPDPNFRSDQFQQVNEAWKHIDMS
jgi:methyl-accepting chemotaxis protein